MTAIPSDTPSPAIVRTQTPSGLVAMAIGAGLLLVLLSLPFWAGQGTIRPVIDL